MEPGELEWVQTGLQELWWSQKVMVQGFWAVPVPVFVQSSGLYGHCGVFG